MKKSISMVLALFLALSLLLTACGESGSSAAAEAFNKGLTAFVSADEQAIATYFTNASSLSFDAISAQSGIDAKEMIGIVCGRCQWKVNSEKKVSDTQVTLNVTVRNGDLSTVLPTVQQKAISWALEQANAGKTVSQTDITKQVMVILKEAADSADMMEKTMDVTMKQENGQWKIIAEENTELGEILVGGLNG